MGGGVRTREGSGQGQVPSWVVAPCEHCCVAPHPGGGVRRDRRNGLHLGVWTGLEVRFPLTEPLVWRPKNGSLGIRVDWVL